MAPRYFNNDFAKKFRHDFIVYLAVEEQYQFENLLIRQFAAKDLELPLLGKQLSEKLLCDRLVGQIIAKLEIRDIPNARRLFKFVQTLKKSRNAWGQKDTYTTGNNGFIDAMNTFYELVNTFQEDIREHFSGNLKKIFTNSGPGVHDGIDCSFTSELLDVIEYYLVNMQIYCDYFKLSLQGKSNNGNVISVTTQMTKKLFKLVALTDNVLVDFKYTFQMVIAWEEHIANLEDQQLYN